MNYNLVLNDNEVNLVWASLENRPYKEVAGLLETIRHQVNAQIEEKNRKQASAESNEEKEDK